ncbi:MAG: OmpP1/FadL family transporter [Spirochaetota bacterium]
MKHGLLLFVACVMVMSHSMLFAINKNQSIEYVRSLNRNASTDVDATFYNPAGLTKLNDGLHMQFSNQTILQTKTIEDDNPAIETYGDDEYLGNVNAYFFPDLHVAYKMGKFAFFGNMMPIGGGGGGEYDDGLPQFELMALGLVNGVGTGVIQQAGQNYGEAAVSSASFQFTDYSANIAFEGEEYNLCWTLGTAYEINTMFSVAGAYRLTRSYRHYTGHAKNISATYNYSDAATDELNAGMAESANQALAAQDDVELDTERIGWGHTFIAGVNVAPMDAMNIGFRMEYSLEQEAEYKTDTLEGPDDIKDVLEDSYGDGKKEKITEPLEFGLGVSYFITDDLRVEADLTYSFNTEVDHDGKEDDYKNMIFAGAAVEYRVLPQLLVSSGYAYDSGNREDEGREETNFGLAVHHIALGGQYEIIEDLDIGLGYIYSIYQEGTREYSSNGETYEQKLNQTSQTIGIGVNYSM